MTLITADFIVSTADIDETLTESLSPMEQVTDLSRRKALAVCEARSDNTDTIIAADTLVSIDGLLLGKPADAADAAQMLRRLSDRTHQVLTGLCVIKNGLPRTACEITDVTFDTMTDDEIAAYIATGEPFDKAGAYGIQGSAAKHITGIRGCYYNVMGLPINLLYKMLKG